MKVYYSERPDEMRYCKLKSGNADVWIRKNIKEVETEEGVQWEADEVYLNTQETLEEVTTRKDQIFDEASAEIATVSERLEAIEEAITVLAEAIYG